MEQGKKKILSDLYAIRATMSLVAENDDHVEPERRAIRDLKYRQWDTQKAISDSEKTLATALSQKKMSAKERMEKLRKERDVIDRDYINRQYKANRSFASCLREILWSREDGCLFLGVILVILIAASVILSFALGSVWQYSIASLGEYWSGVLITAAICLAGICVYFFGICIPITALRRKYDRYRLTKNAAELKNANRELNIATEIYEAFNERVSGDYSWESPALREVTSPKHHCAEVNALIQVHEKEVAELEKKKETLEQQKNPYNKSIQEIAEKSQAIVESATKAYPLIDFRDWENVDLLIYYFETGRADDMKEALQLVDRQRQTEMLAKAIAMASAEICKTIHQSMNQLGNALAQSFSMLSSQMALQHKELLRELKEQAVAQREASEEQLKEIRAQTAAQVTSQEMNRALLAKISESSSDLAYQMNRQMREVHGIPV